MDVRLLSMLHNINAPYRWHPQYRKADGCCQFIYSSFILKIAKLVAFYSEENAID